MFAQLLPGIREIRAPLAAGFLWLLLCWLLVHKSISHIAGPIGELHQLGANLPTAAVGAAASFVAYLVGSLSEDLFGRGLNVLVGSLADERSFFRVGRRYFREDRYSEELTDSFLEAQIRRLENSADRLRSESDLRIALLPPMIALIVYMGVVDRAWWFLALVLAPVFFAQAWVRTRDYLVASRSLFELRQRVGIPPASAREAGVQQPDAADLGNRAAAIIGPLTTLLDDGEPDRLSINAGPESGARYKDLEQRWRPLRDELATWGSLQSAPPVQELARRLSVAVSNSIVSGGHLVGDVLNPRGGDFEAVRRMANTDHQRAVDLLRLFGSAARGDVRPAEVATETAAIEAAAAEAQAGVSDD